MDQTDGSDVSLPTLGVSSGRHPGRHPEGGWNDPITVDQLPSAIGADDEEGSEEIGVLRLTDRARVLPLHAFKTQCEKEYVEMVLQRTNWNVSRAAELLDIQRTHLHQKITTLGIRRPEKAPVQ